jgi:fatty acid desaturase
MPSLLATIFRRYLLLPSLPMKGVRPDESLRRSCAGRSAVRLAVTLITSLSPAILLIARPGWLSFWWLLPAWAIQAVGLTGLSNGAHEAVHGHLFYRPLIDRMTGRALHGFLLLNYDVHRAYHLTHHANTGNEDDSEGVFDFSNLGSKRLYFLKLVRWALPPSPLHILNWSAGVAAIRRRDTHFLGRIPVVSALAGFVVPASEAVALTIWLVLSPVPAIAGGLVPLFFLFPVYAYLTALPEHFGLADFDFKERTRNVRTLPALQYLIWNFNFHAVHHRYPHLHFSLLPGAVHKVPAPTAHGYLRFHLDILRQLAGENEAAPEALGVRL